MSGPPTSPTRAARADGRSSAARAWTIVTAVMPWIIFLQAVTAGRLMRGDDWAETVHRQAAGLILIATLVLAIVATRSLRGRPQHRRMTMLLFLLATLLFAQHSLGSAAAEGSDTLWLHVPLGVAIVGLAAQPMLLARQLD